MRNLLLPLILILTLGAYGQSGRSIRGIVLDSTSSKPVAGATVSLSLASKIVSSATTDSSGAFLLQNLAPGSYTLTISSVGYGNRLQHLVLREEQAAYALGTVLLRPEGKQLSGVTVVSQKALVEDKGDRLVYNAEGDISNASGTAADVLRKVPNLTVDLNGNVQMRGNANIRVLVNGKPSAMMARNLADALRQMPANVIKSVEVITSPGAKYDAEGAAGVINIITKKGLKGFNGSVNATGGNMNNSLGVRLSMRKKKVGFNLSSTAYTYRNIHEGASVRTSLANGVPVNILYRNSLGKNNSLGGYGELSFDYDPDSSSHLNFSMNAWGGNYPNNSTSSNWLTDLSGRELQAFFNDSRFRNPYGNGQMDLGYTRTFKKPEQEFAILAQFSRMPDNYFYTTDRSEHHQVVYREQSTNYSRNKEYTFQTDYTHPWTFNGQKDTTTLRVEAGAKAIIRNIGSEFDVTHSPDGQSDMVPDPSRSNSFGYVQRVYSGYSSLRLSNRRKWNLNAGARMEFTEIEGDFHTAGTSLNSRYNNLIPNITISKGVKRSTFKISYTQRITRPMIWYLNPWLNQSDPKNVSTGNPDLRPELNHMAEISHSLSTPKSLNINTALFTRVTDNAIEYITTVGNEGISYSRPENIAHRKSLGMNLNLSSRMNKDWNLNGGGSLQYIDVRSNATGQQSNGFVWHTNVNTTYKLPKEITLQGNGSLSSGWIGLQNRSRNHFYWYGLSAKREFLNKKATLTFGANNFLKRGFERIMEEKAPTYFGESRFLHVNRSFALTFEFRFGQMSAEGGRQGKKISNDDSGR